MSEFTNLATRGSLVPRLSESRQWTGLPTEFIAKIEEVFKKQFVLEASRGEFIVEGRIYPKEALIRIGYLENGRLRQINFEASIDLISIPSQAGQAPANESLALSNQTIDRIYTLIDSLGGVVEDYFDLPDDELLDIPNRWQAYEFEGETVFLQHSTVNSRLEQEADRLLGLTADQLFNDEADLAAKSEDALLRAEVDSELAEEVQKLIRNGQHPLQKNDTASDDEQGHGTDHGSDHGSDHGNESRNLNS